MNLLIAGTGALACLFAARIASGGTDVTMMGSWVEGLVALQKDGVTLHDLDGSIHQYPVHVLEARSMPVKFEHALVLVKSWQTERVARQLGVYLAEDGVATTLQNGLGNAEVLINSLTPERVALGVTMVGARMLRPGHVQFTGEGKVFLGAHPRLGELEEVLEAGGFEVEQVYDTVALLWGKLVINAAINPLTALLSVPNGELLERPTARALLGEVAKEASDVADRQGIMLPYPDPVTAVENVARGTAANYSSMLQDVLRGAETEIDAINGAVVRLGEETGVPIPINRILWQLVKSLHKD